MQFKDAFASLKQEHPEDALFPLYTPWGENLDAEHIWQEYPRPQMRREDYHMLNGWWDCAFAPDAVVTPGSALPNSRKILVPFSPEALLSGVGRQLQPTEYLWYQRKLCFSQKECAWKQLLSKRCLLHFGAVDQQAVIYINGIEVTSHVGGYLLFTADITEYVSDSPCLLQVKVRDESDTSYFTRGKQTLKRGGMFYTAQSGIWQSVWYEWVPENAVTDYRITPDLDNRAVTVELHSAKPFAAVSCKLYQAETFSGESAENVAEGIYGKREISCQIAAANCITTLTIQLSEKDLHLWSPENPFLYPLCITADEDVIHSYFAMRSFTVETDSTGIPRFCLNHKPYFLHGILDQGYWSDGLMTAPCDEAFIYDIKLAKKYGFNMLRKHIKIEPMRWYFHCDRLGMIVWQDMVNGGSHYHMPLICYMPTLFPHISMHTKDHHYNLFSRAGKDERLDWEQECKDTMDHLYNVPSLAVWVPFNEGWGQFDAERIAQMVKEKDPTRPVDHASGWFDQKGGDFRSIHNYFRPLRVKLDGKRAYVISEYGGYACHIEDHSAVERSYGYKKFDTPEQMSSALHELLEKQLFPLAEQGLSGAVYTQLSDVEEEVNGLVTYDRRIEKFH